MTEQTALDLPAIRALHAGITPGPWFQGRESVRHESEKEVYSEREPSRTSEDICTAWHPHDAAFIAAAPSIVTQLLAKVEAQQSALAKVELACDAMDAGVSIRAGDPRTKSHAATAIRAAIREALGEDA